jgi:predicted nucleotidyltransferase
MKARTPLLKSISAGMLSSSIDRLFIETACTIAAANERQQDDCDPELSHNGVMLTLDTLRGERKEEILRLAARRGAHNLRVFGSVARGEANETSDLDLLVAWEPGRSLLDHAGLVQDLQELLGMKVHVGTEKSLHWYVRDRILREATPL